jgi:hypothetical protein
VADGWRRFNPVHRLRLGWIPSNNIKDRSLSDTVVTLASASAPTGTLPGDAVVVYRVVNAIDGWQVPLA